MSSRLMPLLYMTLVLTVCSISLSAQEDFIPEVTYGDIPVEQLQMKEYDLDTGACAVILGDLGNLSFTKIATDIYYVFTRTKRIKILKNECREEANIEIPYVTFQGAEKIEDLKAHTVLPDGRMVPVSKDQMVTEKVDDFVESMNFNFPEVERGSILEYSYTIRSQLLTRIRPWLFQNELPTVESALKIEVPNWMELAYMWSLSEEMNEQSSENNNTELKGERSRLIETSDGWFIMQDIPSVEQEPLISSLANYTSRVEILLKNLNIEGQYVDLISTWPTAIERLNTNPNFGQQLENQSNYKKILNALKPLYDNKTDPLEKANTIYSLVQKSMEWNGNYSIVSSGELDNAFENGSGNSADINLTLLALLREAGYMAKPVLLRTRSNGKVHPEIPYLGQFNHMLVFLELENQGYLLDPLYRHIPFGATHLEALTNQGMVISEGTVGWIDIPIFKGKDSYYIQYNFNELNNITGKIKATYSNYNAFGERASHFSNAAREKWIERMKTVLDEATTDTIETKNLKNLPETFEETFDFNGRLEVKKEKDTLFVKPLMISSFRENKLDSEKRDLPIEFPYPFSEQIIVQFKIPDGYRVLNLPNNTKIQLADGGGSFSYLASEQMGNVLCKFNLDINSIYFEPNSYPFIKNIFSSAEKKLKEEIVLIVN